MCLRSKIEMAVLRAQNESIRGFQDSVLGTVFWALGGVFALAILLAGFGWWSNFKLYEADKRKLKEEFEARLADFQTESSTKYASIKSDIERSVDAKNEAFISRLLGEVSSLRDSIAPAQAQLLQSVVELKDGMGELKEEAETLGKKIAETNADMRQAEELIWEGRGIHGNVLLTQTQGLGAALLAKSDYHVKSVLSRMKDTLTKDANREIALTAAVKETVDKTLASASDFDPIAVAELRSLIKRVPDLE
jgi:hypothetical protein